MTMAYIDGFCKAASSAGVSPLKLVKAAMSSSAVRLMAKLMALRLGLKVAYNAMPDPAEERWNSYSYETEDGRDGLLP